MLAKDLADKEYVFVTSTLRAITIYPTRQNNTQAESVKNRVSLDKH